MPLCKRRPYTLKQSRVRKSPFRTTQRVRSTLRALHRGAAIGFTARSSLKSMGLLPRADGRGFCLGDKYH
jgi:hypothetical protein